MGAPFFTALLFLEVDCKLQYSSLITSHTRGIFSMAPHNISHGNYVWHGVLPRVEKSLAAPRNCHVWRSQPYYHTWLISKAMACAVTRDEETHYSHCFEAYLYHIIN